MKHVPFEDLLNHRPETWPATPARGTLVLGVAAALLAAALGSASRAEAQSSGWVAGHAYDAIVGGIDSDGKALYVCMSDDPAWEGQQVGKRQAGWSTCAFGYGGEEINTGAYLTLTPTWTRDLVGTPLGREANGTAQSFCHGWYEGGLHVGKQIGAGRGCSIGYDKKEVWLSDYAVLQQFDSFAIFATSNVKPFPVSAIVGGKEKDGKLLYLCRAQHAGGQHLGKTRSDWSDCAIGYGADEVRVKTYEVFVPDFRQGVVDTATRPLFLAGGEHGQPFGVCAGWYASSMQVGKYLFADKLCHIGYDNKEQKTANFSTLRLLR